MDNPLYKSCRNYRYLVYKAPPFLIHLCYFIILSLIGYLALTISKPRNTSISLNSFDVFFTSVSSVTVSSMSTIEMEVFSNTQLIIMTFLMFFGGEVFTSMLDLQLKKFKLIKSQETTVYNNDGYLINTSKPSKYFENVELGVINYEHHQTEDSENKLEYPRETFRFECIKILICLVPFYLFVVHTIGSCLILIYMSFVPNAEAILKNKGLNLPTFSFFTTVSTFANCGFIPTNENMIVFKKNPGFLLILIPQILLGNTLYPVILFLAIWVFKKTTKKEEFSYMLENPGELGYDHLFPWRKTILLAGTVLGFILVQFVMFCSLEWDSEATQGLNSYEKLVGSLFQVVNSRHTGESVFDLSLVTPAILVVFTVMMYFPGYTSLSPVTDEVTDTVEENDKQRGEQKKKSRRKSSLIECILFSQLSYLVIFIVLICITERGKMKDDPLNFNVLNIVFEVISAYGNVGFSMGYSCERQIKPDGQCKDAWFGFVGRWSNKGKFILILVMFFGRLKKFNVKGGKAWKLS